MRKRTAQDHQRVARRAREHRGETEEGQGKKDTCEAESEANNRTQGTISGQEASIDQRVRGGGGSKNFDVTKKKPRPDLRRHPFRDAGQGVKRE
ncbi:hypothetical protein C922_05089 [Plasmodium inui San Antonio 1]|uniref:Uncharacterized protein n=1 Tax=Plasmodium inui San Antonio 1 TaxID=1237626 RepID=W6ZUU9_9APIC|nr:hypothetical protein C922_05089 [Plasmodium inui San Antonio 1]EUD64527.1 hypothetical protein C922_05089 [Plasmodium inui San Antonio 1]